MIFISFILSHVFIILLAYAFIVLFLQTQRVFYSHLQTTLSSLVIVGCFVFSVLLLMLHACKFFEAYVRSIKALEVLNPSRISEA